MGNDTTSAPDSGGFFGNLLSYGQQAAEIYRNFTGQSGNGQNATNQPTASEEAAKESRTTLYIVLAAVAAVVLLVFGVMFSRR